LRERSERSRATGSTAWSLDGCPRPSRGERSSSTSAARSKGFGADSHLHTSRILRLSKDLPVVIEMVDTPEQIDRVVPILDEMVGEGMLTLERVQIVSYRSSDE
jgi:hypothetical protein